MMEHDFHIVASESLPNVFYIFREYGVEVKVTVKGGEYMGNRPLNENEKEFFESEIITK